MLGDDRSSVSDEGKPTNIRWHEGLVDRQGRWDALGLCGATLWLTGLSGSGKSSLAVALERRLIERKIACYRLDGDNLRHGLNANLGFSAADRDENIRRAGEVARLFADYGCIVLAAFISPYRAARAQIQARHQEASLPFLEVHVDTPLEICEARDPKGLYKKARAGEIQGMTGLDAPYEAPEQPALRIAGGATSLEAGVEKLELLLWERGLIPAL